jgi:acyl carrier protein
MAIPKDGIVEAVVQVLVEKLGAEGVSEQQLTAETPLLSSGLNLDSVVILELLLEIENRFRIQFDDADLSVELFRDVGALAEGVRKKFAAKAVSA